MNVVEAVNTCLITKYADFYDRAPRSEFWWFLLSMIVVLQFCYWVIEIWLVPMSLYWLVIVVPTSVILEIPVIAVTARRLHDIGRSGWDQLWLFLPTIGTLIVLWWMIKPGDRSDNRYGPSPLN